MTLDDDSITLNDNYIGLNLAGAKAGNGGNGVFVWGESDGDLIGQNPSDASGVVANVISGNRLNGIELAGSSSNTVVDNRIGTNAAGTSAIANGGDGIYITHGSRSNEIGGTAFVDTRDRPGEQSDREQGDGDAGLRGAAARQPDIGQRPQRRADRHWLPRQRAERELHRDDGERGRRPR